jgi:hypothetical protein
VKIAAHVGRAPHTMPPIGGRKTNYGVKPTDRVKLNPDKVQIYTVGIPNTNIKKLTKKSFKHKHTAYVDQFYTAQDLDYTSTNMTMSAIIDTANGINKDVFKPTCAFSDNWDVSPMGKYLGEWYFRDPKEEVEGRYNYEDYRQDMLHAIYRSRDGKRGDIHDYLHKKLCNNQEVYIAE